MKHFINKVQIIKTVAFVLIFLLLFVWATDILQAKWIDGTSVTFVQEGLYDQKKNTIDVAVLGSSQMVYGVSSMRMLEKYGISAYSAATGEQPVLCGYFYLREMVRSQDIKIVLYDVSMLYEKEQEARFRKTLDLAPMSRNKLWMMMKHRSYPKRESTWTYLFPMMKYHSRWDELQRMDYKYDDLNTEVFKGNIMSPETSQKVRYGKVCVDNDVIDKSVVMDESETANFREMVDYCKEQGIELILVKTPKQSWTKSAMVGVEQLAEEYDLTYMDFNTAELMEEIGLDVSTDFWNGDHLNIRGAEKLTDYLAEYLLQNYELADGRKTEAYDIAEEERYQMDRENKYLMTSYDIDDLTKRLKNERYEVVLQASGDLSSRWSEEYQEAFEALGMQMDIGELKKKYFVGHYRNGGRIYEETKEEPFLYKGEFSDGRVFKLSSKFTGEEALVTATVGKETVFYNKKGLNFSVYDHQNGKLVDSFTLYYDKEKDAVCIYRNR